MEKELINAMAGNLGGVIELKKLGYTDEEIQYAYDLLYNRKNSLSNEEIKKVMEELNEDFKKLQFPVRICMNREEIK